DDLLLADSNLVEFLVCDQRIGYISKGALNGLLVNEQSLLVLRFGSMEIPAKGAARENGLTYLDAIRPDRSVGAHHAGEQVATSECATTTAGQGDLRKELGPGDTNHGVRGDQVLLSLANVGPAFEQRGRHPRRHFRRQRLLRQRASARHALRVIAKENTDRIFLL